MAAQDPDGTRIANYVLHYADGRQYELPVIYGDHVRNWATWYDMKEIGPGAVVAWTGTNAYTAQNKSHSQLFKTTWENPRPEVEIKNIDFVSTMSISSPLLLAITVE